MEVPFGVAFADTGVQLYIVKLSKEFSVIKPLGFPMMVQVFA